MKLLIKSIGRATSAEWDEAWRHCGYATYFHSREWAEIWQVATSGKLWPAARMIIFSDGQKAVLPLSCCGQRSLSLGKEYISSPEGTYGGWISSSVLSLEHAQLLTEYMLKKCGNLLWRINPYDPHIFKTGIKPTDRETYRLDLSTGFECIISKFVKTNIVAIRKAQEYGITIRVASTIQDWQEYFKAYEDSLARWGEDVKSGYSWAVFKEIYDRQSPSIRLWLASYKGKVISGVLCFYSKYHVDAWHAAGLKEYFIYRPVNLLHYEIIKNACLNNYWWYDFNPSHGLTGVIAFKKTFGTENVSCPIIQVRTKLDILLGKVGPSSRCWSFLQRLKPKGKSHSAGHLEKGNLK